MLNSSRAKKTLSGRMKMTASFVMLSAVLVLGLLPGCAENTVGTTTAPPTVASNETVYPLTVKDMTGREVTFNKAPTKIVSLAPSNTEVLFELGLGDKIVGVTTYCDYPAAAKDKTKMGGYSTVDLEKVLAAGADLVLASNLHIKDVVPKLANWGVPVFVLDPKALNDIYTSIELVGKVTNTQVKAKEITDSMKQRVEAVALKTRTLTDTQRPRTLYLVWHDPPMTVGPNTFIYEMINLAGGASVSKGMKDGFPTMTLEAIIGADPQIVLASGMGGPNMSLEYIKGEPRLSVIEAREKNGVYEVNQDVVLRMGPRVVEGLEAMAKLIQPGIFK